MNNFPPRCYYCNETDFSSVDEYERHVVTKYPNLDDVSGFVRWRIIHTNIS